MTGLVLYFIEQNQKNIKFKRNKKSMYKTNTNYVSRRRQTQASSRSYGRNNNIAIFQPTAKLGAVTQFLMLGILIAVLGIIFLMNSSKPALYGNEIQQIDSKISDLETKKADLEVENARLTALSNIENSEVAKKMTTPASVSYAK